MLETLIRRVNLIIINDIHSLMEIVFCNVQLNLLDKDKDKEALFNVAYNVTDNISS